MANVSKTFHERFGSIILASIALVQPLVIYLWKKYIRSGKINFLETDNLEIAFSGFASTVYISGSFRAIQNDLVFSQIQLEKCENH